MVFRDYNRQNLYRQAWQYGAVFFFNIIANLGLMYYLVEYQQIYYLLAQVFSGAILGLIGFLVNHLVVFRKLKKTD